MTLEPRHLDSITVWTLKSRHLDTITVWALKPRHLDTITVQTLKLRHVETITVQTVKPRHLEEDCPLKTFFWKRKILKFFRQWTNKIQEFNYATVESFKTVWIYQSSQETALKFTDVIGPFAKKLENLKISEITLWLDNLLLSFPAKRAQKLYTDGMSLAKIWLVLLIGRCKFSLSHDQSEALPRSGWWCVISMEFLRSFLRCHFMVKPVLALQNVG